MDKEHSIRSLSFEQNEFDGPPIEEYNDLDEVKSQSTINGEIMEEDKQDKKPRKKNSKRKNKKAAPTYLDKREDDNSKKIKDSFKTPGLVSFAATTVMDEVTLYSTYREVSVLRTVVGYLISELKKKQTSFNIGIFTVFLVVTFLTLLQSVVDISPVAFLKIASDTGGAIDFQLTPNFEKPFINGNKNYYNMHPFKENQNVETGRGQQLLNSVANISNDHAEILNFEALQYNDMKEQLANMTHFEGFAPRWLIPTRLRNSENTNLNASVILLIIDSKRETEIGLGKHFSQTILGYEEIMIYDPAVKFMQVTPQKRDQVEIYFDIDMIKQLLHQFGGDYIDRLLTLIDKYGDSIDNFVDGNIDQAKPLSETFTISDIYDFLSLIGYDIPPDQQVAFDLTEEFDVIGDLLRGQELTISYAGLKDIIPGLGQLNLENQKVPVIISKFLYNDDNSTEHVENVDIQSIEIQGNGWDYMIVPQDGIWRYVNLVDNTIDPNSELGKLVQNALKNLESTGNSSTSTANQSNNVNDKIKNSTNESRNFNSTGMVDDDLIDQLEGYNLKFDSSTLFGDDVKIDVGSFIKFIKDQDFSVVNVSLQRLLEYLLNNLVMARFPKDLKFTYTLKETYDSPHGKFSGAMGNTAIIDCEYVLFSIIPKIYESIQSQISLQNPFVSYLLTRFRSQIDFWNSEISLCNYALQVNGVLKQQTEYYIYGNNHMKNQLTERGNDIIDRISLSTNATITTPLMTSLKETDMMKIFLNNTMITIVFFLGLLCVQLVYSLMLSDVEEKTYTYGMLRALGFQKRSLFTLISFKSLSFSLPALFSGLLVAYFLNVAVRFILYQISENNSSYYLSGMAVMLGVLVGILLPVISNMIPIQRALSKNLRSSLDLYHRAINEITVSVKRIEDMGLSMNQLVIGFTLVILGILTYYVAPMSFIMQNFQVFFFILNLVLIFMILGLSFISVLLFPAAQEMFLRLFLLIFYKDRKLYPLVKKNLSGHAGRNTKTAMMFTIALSFLIFSASTFQLIAHLISSTLQSQFPGDFFITASYSNLYLNEKPLISFMEEQKAFDGAVVDWTFSPPELSEFLSSIAPNYQTNFKFFISASSNFYQIDTKVYSMQKNYLDVVYDKFYIPAEVEQGLNLNRTSYSGSEDAIEALYIDDNLISFNGSKDPFDITTTAYPRTTNNFTVPIKMIIPEGLREPLSIDTETTTKLCVGFQLYGSQVNCNYNYMGKTRAMVSKMPALMFSKYRQVMYFSQIVISEDQYRDIAQNIISGNSYMTQQYDEMKQKYDFNNGIPKEFMIVKLNSTLDESRRKYLANGIRSYFKDEMTQLIDMKDLLNSVASSINLFQIFVGIVGAIALILAFFLLLISTTQNIKDNSWEFGVLRSIGLNQSQSTRVYVYEAFAVICGAITLGILVGIIVAITLTAQFYLFVQLPFEMTFPYSLFIAMVGMALITTLFAVLIPVNEINKKEIAVIIKGNA